jgi:hypothetical protein
LGLLLGEGYTQDALVLTRTLLEVLLRWHLWPAIPKMLTTS